MSKTYVIIPDSHAHPDYTNERFLWLGRLIYDIRPDAVIDIGDSADMPSLCSYDKGTKGFDQRTFVDDCDTYKAAMEMLWHPYRSSKKKLPFRAKCRGNHEVRIKKAEALESTWSGLYGIEDLEEERYNNEVHEFLQEAKYDGITFNHYAPTDLLNKPIGGVFPARSILLKKHKTYITGHDHRRFEYEEAGLISLVVGCYVDYHAEFAGPANANWWRGIVVLRMVEDGYFDHQWISLRAIKEMYSGR